eukprot:jgi/Botrbrau1/11790/Bobra.0195s0114.1
MHSRPVKCFSGGDLAILHYLVISTVILVIAITRIIAKYYSNTTSADIANVAI